MNMTYALNEKMMVVEDDADLRDAISESLQGIGCEVIAAASGEDALEAMRQECVFAIVSDYRMPGINGLELCRRVKEEFPKVKFVILTGYADKNAVLEGLRVGIDDLLEKPQDLIRLRDMAEKFVSDRISAIKKEQEEMRLIRKIFCDDANSLLKDMEKNIVRIENADSQSEVVDDLFRRANALKESASAFQGAEKICAVTQAYENLFQAIRSGKLVPSQSLTQVLLQASGVIKILISDFEGFKETKINLQPFVEALNRWTQGRTPAAEQVLSLTNRDSGALQQDHKPASGQQNSKSGGPESEQSAAVFNSDDSFVVSNEKLHAFMDLSGELLVLKNAYDATMRQISKFAVPPQQKLVLEELNQSLERISGQIQSQITDVRKVELKAAFQKFPRFVRQVSQDFRKHVNLEMNGIDLGVDRKIARCLSENLVHLLRNSVEHGIELPRRRADTGKPEQGKISVSARQTDQHIVVTVEDDGLGIELERVRRKAMEMNLADKQTLFSMNDQDVADFVFAQGFTTAEDKTGGLERGTGMSVLKSEIVRLGGTVKIDTTFGLGTKITITVPVPKPVLIENSLLAVSGGHQIVIPLVNITKIASVRDLMLSKVDGRMTCQHEGMTVPLGDYKSFIESPLHGSSAEKEAFLADALVLIISHGKHSVALYVDRVVDQREVVVRPFDNVVRSLPGFKGTSLLDSEQVAFVLDGESLLNEAFAG
ncbi:MAG: response regulator [Proteobacteria bacterium]|nr:response regulator [Pseudomonadota bacterium]